MSAGMVRYCASIVLLLSCISAQRVLAEPDFESIWRLKDIYRGPDEALVEALALSGRAQLDWVTFDADQGEFDGTRWRRFRFGGRADLRGGYVALLEGDFDFNEKPGSSYSRLTEAYLGWSTREGWDIKVLKHSVGFTLDGATSSKELLTPERNVVSANLWFPDEYFTGASLRRPCLGESRCRIGVYSSSDNDGLSHFSSGGWFAAGTLERDVSGVVPLDEARVRVDYVYNDFNERDNNTRPFNDIVSMVAQLRHEGWNLDVEVARGWGHRSQSDLSGLVLMPYLNITERWQLVGRYTWMDSDDPAGIRLTEYEQEIVPGMGDEYHEVFLGLNWYIFGHRLKWQQGLVYGEMDDRTGGEGEYQGWGFSSSLRIYW